jgi:hypothetical protein
MAIMRPLVWILIFLLAPVCAAPVSIPAFQEVSFADSSTQKVENTVNAETNQVPEWEPLSCWDCSTPDEPPRLFFAGLIFAIPISTWLTQRKTRANDSLYTKTYLGI